MLRKRCSLILFLLGLALLLSIPIHGLWSGLTNSNTITEYEKKALEYQKSPELVEPIEKKLMEENAQNIEDPFSHSETGSKELPEDAVGFVKMPKINEIIPLYMGASDRNLANGCAHITGTDLPLSGKGSHTVIAGHRWYYGPTYFLYIDYLMPGDLIYVSYFGKEMVYAVTGNELIDPENGEKLTEKKPNEEWLTLLTCHPFPTALQRLLVHAKGLTDEEISKIPLDERTSESQQIEIHKNQDTSLDHDKTVASESFEQEVKPNRISKIIGGIGQYSFWVYIGLIVVGGGIFSFKLWCLLATWL